MALLMTDPEAPIPIDRDALRAEIALSRQSRDPRRTAEWVRSLELVDAAAAAVAAVPVELHRCQVMQLLRYRHDAAIWAAESVAFDAAMQVVIGIVDGLRGSWQRTLGVTDADGESFAAWARRNPGAEVHLGEHRVTISDNGRAVTVRAKSLGVGGRINFDAGDDIPIDGLADWEPPERWRDPWLFALSGWFGEAELLDLAATDPVSAACSPNATAEVFRAANARIVADRALGLLVGHRYVMAGSIRGLSLDQVTELAMRLWPRVDLTRRPIVID
jgi:hypothetical protein